MKPKLAINNTVILGNSLDNRCKTMTGPGFHNKSVVETHKQTAKSRNEGKQNLPVIVDERRFTKRTKASKAQGTDCHNGIMKHDGDIACQKAYACCL